MIDCNADSILHAESVAPIDNRAREKVIGLSVGLLTRLYGDYPSKTQKETLAQCLVTLFPSFASVKTGGFVSKPDYIYENNIEFDILNWQEKVYNVANGGWVGQRLKNHRRAKKSDSDSADQQPVKTIDVTEELEFLRSCVITNDSSNIDRMKTALQRTFVYRQHLIKEKKQMDLVREFSFFFTNAEWVWECDFDKCAYYCLHVFLFCSCFLITNKICQIQKHSLKVGLSLVMVWTLFSLKSTATWALWPCMVKKSTICSFYCDCYHTKAKVLNESLSREA